METIKKNRKVLRTLFTKNSKELEQLIAQKTELSDIKVSCALLSEKSEKLKVLDEQLYALLLEPASEEDLLAEMETCETYNKIFVSLNTKVLDISPYDGDDGPSNNSVISETGNTNNDRGKRKFKLPTIAFKTFDGNIKDWLPFWSQFSKVHEDPDIDLNDKVEYLIQATVPSSRARQLVESFPAVGKNYYKIVDSLKSRFGREDLQVEVYVRELLKLIINNALSRGRIDLSMLYDGIETQLRALETLGITSSGCSSMLFPLIESCLPEDLLRVWQRSPLASSALQSTGTEITEEPSLKNKLSNLMQFLRNEVENEQRISLATEGFGLHAGRSPGSTRGHNISDTRRKIPEASGQSHIPTATGLINHEKVTDNSKCIFCENVHESANCFKAQNFTMEKKRSILNLKKACFNCLKIGHSARKCRGRLKCIVCSKSHVTLMCPDLLVNRSTKDGSEGDQKDKTVHKSSEMLSCTNGSGSFVFLQTLRVTIHGPNGTRSIRALIDTGSQNTYIVKNTAELLGYSSKRQSKILHCLFGGVTCEQSHECYDVELSNDKYSCTIEALSQPTICGEVLPVFNGPWVDELRKLHIQLSDIKDAAPIELLIGSDIAGRLYTGKRHILSSNLVAIQTLLGWTLMGRIPLKEISSTTLSAISLFVNDASLTQLWQLDTLGITDPVEQKTQEQTALAAKNLFLETVKVNQEGRYEIRLPWFEGHPPLPSNYGVAKKRLEGTVKRLNNNGLLEAYNQVFTEWVEEGIIEEVSSECCSSDAHYLPHRPVVKEGSTTRIRPVFDASAKEQGGPSLNQCLEKGPNLIELIPDILIRFRQNKIGVTADIRKAFLQISVHPNDRDFVRFLWVDSDGHEKIYRHRRVIFGVNSSPFLLGATIEYHISQAINKCKKNDKAYSIETLSRLADSFYVDNCVASVPNTNTLENFIRESSAVMAEGLFDLRGWEYSHQEITSDIPKTSPLLGLVWDTQNDTLGINGDFLKELESLLDKPITKRIMLSVTQKVFDPIGFTCPTTLIPKLLLQKTWEKKIGWDKEVEQEIKEDFVTWLKNLPHLLEIKIPRWIHAGSNDAQQLSLHTFCDASKNAYSSVVFLKCVQNDQVFIHLLAAKSRVAPIKKMTIPRLELLAAVIGTRLCTSVKNNLKLDLECFFWTDSTTVLSWISRNEEWGTFVHNRVLEIRQSTSKDMWRHVPGVLNVADLPSRGCSAKQLKKSKWWEGPGWLYKEGDAWPKDKIYFDEEEISQEKRKTVVTSLLSTFSIDMTIEEWHLLYFSKYMRAVRMIAWILRFCHNIRSSLNKHKGELTMEEMDTAEEFVIKLIQKNSFQGDNDRRLNTLNCFKDKSDIIRVKSQVSNRKDSEHFRFPVVLPSKHPIVTNLIFDEHIRLCHVRTQGLMCVLREKFWILGGRRAIKSAISKCVVCKRYHSRSVDTISPPLPLDRVREASAFEVSGVDFAGPLYLKGGQKVWICLFTCAIYRAVHFELCSSLSVPNFLLALRRFIARRGRPKTIYSDNGTNFVGTDNAFNKLDWDKIIAECCVRRITWKFNPPTGSWWGGFFERMVGALKQLLRKTLGRASLNYEELITILCDCESVINSRPLTYMSTDANEMEPLTPMMFLRDLPDNGVPDLEAVNKASLCKRVLYQNKVGEDLRQRFRNEYLGQLKNSQNKKSSRQIRLGEVVLIGNDDGKRLDWPLGRVSELLPGKDGHIRVVKLKTARGQLLRPIQRLYPLECADARVDPENGKNIHHKKSAFIPETARDESQEFSPVSKSTARCAGVNNQSRVSDHVVRNTVTRSGRETKIPQRFKD